MGKLLNKSPLMWSDSENGYARMVDKVEFRIEGDTITVLEILGEEVEPFCYSISQLRADLMLYALGGDAPADVTYRSAIVIKALLGRHEPEALPKELVIGDDGNIRNVLLLRLDKINELLPLPTEGNNV